MTDKQTPTDAELNTILCDHWPAFASQSTLVKIWVRDALQDAIDKWGQPAKEAESTKAISGTQKHAICDACGSELLEVLQSPNSYLSAEQFDADKLGDWYCKCCPKGPSNGSSTHRYFWNRDLGSTAAQSAESVPAVSDLPPLPAPDLRDVGTKPQEIKEFLKGYATEYARTAIAARAPADSVQEDAALWHWLAEYLVGTRTDLDDEIVASETVNDLRKLVKATIKQGEKQ